MWLAPVAAMHALLLALTLAQAAPWAFATNALVKVRPGTSLDRRTTVALELGRGECQAAQLVVPEGAPTAELAVEVTPPMQLGRTLDVALSREEVLDVKHPSNAEGHIGPWPDILIPDVDSIVHERRRAFPYDAAGNLPVVIYVDVCASAGLAPGSYVGELRVHARGRPTQRIPLRVTLLRYTLPATSSLPTAFGFSGISAARAHGLNPRDPDAVLALTQRYATMALAHRISLFGMTMEPPTIRRTPSGMDVDFRAYDRELAPFLDGTALPSGARFTSTELRSPAKLSDTDQVLYDAAVARHVRERGWLDRVFLYAPDEPSPPRFPEVRHVAALAHQADPKLRVLVTASRQPGLEDTADLWTPNMVCLFARPEAQLCPAMAEVDAYAVARARGAKLWWYQSCSSHGCAPVTGRDAEAYTGWPSYMVDLPMVLNRAMGVAAYRYGIEGELYYSTTEAYDGDPWRDVWRFHGNGDGTLFYPGTPARIGGQTEVPLASLRLQAIRDGLQDFELLRLADSVGLHDLAQRTAAQLVRRAWDIERDPEVWLRARAALAEAVDARSR